MRRGFVLCLLVMLVGCSATDAGSTSGLQRAHHHASATKPHNPTATTGPQRNSHSGPHRVPTTGRVDAAPAACPARYRGTAPWVPSQPASIDRVSRMVPPRTPNAAVLCRYPVTAKESPLRGRRRLTGDLSRMAGNLSRVGRARPGQPSACITVYRQRIDFLIGLSYPDAGTLWVSVSDDVTGCTNASNGRFRTWSDFAPQTESAFRTGQWPGTPKPYCTNAWTGRLGQERSMVPPGSISLTICDRENHGRTIHSGYGELVQALDRLPTRPAGWQCSPSPPRSAPVYQLLFRYPTGPAVQIGILSGCYPEVSNLSLESRSAATVLPLVERLAAR